MALPLSQLLDHYDREVASQRRKLKSVQEKMTRIWQHVVYDLRDPTIENALEDDPEQCEKYEALECQEAVLIDVVSVLERTQRRLQDQVEAAEIETR